ncbi:helix-turn-helix domain-containing protein [Neobacillus sp. Marseille-QA0830]
MIEKLMLDVKDVMAIIGIGRNNAYDLLKSGEFQVRKIGNRYLVHKEVLENWLKGEKSNTKRSRW